MNKVRGGIGLLRAVRIGAVCGFLAGACSDAGGSPHEPPPLDPPPNIDVVSCHDIGSTDFMITAECSACCSQNGFSASTSFQDRCVCGNARDNSGDTVCADQAASADICFACCEDAGFDAHGWSSGTGVASSCRCHARRDSVVCAGALADAQPATSCRICCLNNGYIGTNYSNLGTQECVCVDP